MFRKSTIIKGLIFLLVVEVLVSTGWAVWWKFWERKGEEEQTEIQPKAETTKSEVERYISEEILFLPWGFGEGEIGLKETQIMVQGMAPETVRYGASKIEVDKEGNIFIFDEVNQRIQKYSKERKGLLSLSFRETKKRTTFN
jgi:hypothetical protein